MILKAFLVVLLVCGGITAQTSAARRTMAVTIDDLPYVTIDAPYLSNAQRATPKILQALKTYNAPVVAFVNEAKLDAADQRAACIALLQSWVNAGAILGNHTYSHKALDAVSVEQFEEEIVKGDVVTRGLMKSREPYQLYFRHPMTHTGDTVAKKLAIEKFLAARGYKVTPHTIENSDFIYNVGYALAMHKQDATSAQRIRENYLHFTIAATEFAEKISPQIFGREIPQVLLIHANDINADCLDELLKRFEARGYRFVSLDEAMADPAYQTKDNYVGKYGPTWFVRWAKSMGMRLSFKGDPDPPQWIMDLYNQR